MRLSWHVLTFATLLGATACKGFPFPWRAEPDPVSSGAEAPMDDGPQDSARIRLELQDIRYDGWVLRGRLLLTTEEGLLRLDKRLIESTVLSTKSVTDCATGQAVEFMVVDVFARPPQPEDILRLEPGYWYGKDIHLPLFASTPDRQRGPSCIEADLVFHALGQAATPLHVRAESPPPPPEGESPSDGGS